MRSQSKQLLRNIYLSHVYIRSEKPDHYQIYPTTVLLSQLFRNIFLPYVYINSHKPLDSQKPAHK